MKKREGVQSRDVVRQVCWMIHTKLIDKYYSSDLNRGVFGLGVDWSTVRVRAD